MKVTEGKPTDFTPDKDNANQGSPRGQKMIQESLQEDGAGRGIVVDKNDNVVAGSKTLESAVDVGIDKAIIVETTGNELVITKRLDWDLYEDSSPRRYAYRDNRSSEISLNWDPTQLLLDKEAGVDFNGLFYENEFDEITAEAKKEPPEESPPPIDKAAELQEKWQCQPGQIWQIESATNPGKYHRLICGDCRDIETVKRLTEGRKINGSVTSPPYAMQRIKQYGGVETDKYVDWWEAVQENVRAVLAEDGSFFVNIKPHCKDGQRSLYVMDLVQAMVRIWRWRFVDELCWKHQGIPGDYKGRFKNQFEPIYHFTLGNHKHNPGNVSYPTNHTGPTYDQNRHIATMTKSPFEQGTKMSYDGMARPGNVLEIGIGDAENHAAAFPLQLPSFFILAFSDLKDYWLDPFCGSGTTIIACEQNKRVALGCEKLEKYCAVILERCKQSFGIDPILIEAGPA